jgi:predicted nucleotidyltransferase
MYVQINKDTRDSLHRNVIAKMCMGSHAHGLADERSDEDILYVYYDKNYGNTIFNETNGWQYKNGNVDENYQELRVFIQNVLTAKMCGNLEALLDGWEFNENNLNDDMEHALHVIFSRLKDIKSYALAKSYLGYIKKDIKHTRKMLADSRPLASRDLHKKLAHIIRGIDTVAYLLDYDNYAFYRESLSPIKHLAKQIKFGYTDLTYEFVYKLINDSEQGMCEMRVDLNARLDTGNIYRRCNPVHLDSIHNMLNGFISHTGDTFDVIDYDDDLRYNILEKGESFQYN